MSISIRPMRQRYLRLAIRSLGSVLLLTASAGGLATAPLTEEQRRVFTRPSHITYPESAPYSPQVATLGKMLFFDPRLSKAQNMSCASCHNPSFGWETPVVKAIGALNVPLDRHAPTVINLSSAPALFWDGRAASLEEQARGPITNPFEMNMQMDDLIARLKRTRGYKSWFERLFPGEGLTERTLLASIAMFERTLESGWADFDDWMAGDELAVSDEAKSGFALFIGKARCVACHTGWSFTDHEFHDIGLDTDDIGRAAVDDDRAGSMHAFKTPTLRNIFLRAPYMHNGEYPTLEAVLEHYDSGGIRRDSLSPNVRPIGLTVSEKRRIVAFLKTLTEQSLNVSTPVLPAE